MKNTPRGVYIHIPFCKYICSYCDLDNYKFFDLIFNLDDSISVKETIVEIAELINSTI